MTLNLQEVSQDPPVKVKKKRINSKQKGSGFELSIAKQMSIALAPLNFKRTQQSGAITGGFNSRSNHKYSNDALTLFVGDICPINEADVSRDCGWKLKFTLECKFYKTADNIDHLLSNTKIRRWFEQACTDAVKIEKEPLLIFKFNHTEIFAACNSDTIKTLPSTLTRSLAFDYQADGDMPARRFTVFHFKEALLDLAWWKKFNEENTNPITTWSEP